MNDKFKDLKLTVQNVMKLKKVKNYPDIFDKVSMREIDDIFNIIDRYSNNSKAIEREIKKYINKLL